MQQLHFEVTVCKHLVTNNLNLDLFCVVQPFLEWIKTLRNPGNVLPMWNIGLSKKKKKGVFTWR